MLEVTVVATTSGSSSTAARFEIAIRRRAVIEREFNAKPVLIRRADHMWEKHAAAPGYLGSWVGFGVSVWTGTSFAVPRSLPSFDSPLIKIGTLEKIAVIAARDSTASAVLPGTPAACS